MSTRNLSDRYHDDPVLDNQLDEGLNGACTKNPITCCITGGHTEQ